ncbi:hypothetical protein NUH87_31110 [Pseudomonas batumici]|uniref:scabin-related ADP-ribosyltransferase n=1 Tax=Pseudomonas batumici TaxID=226910 RepID=UPI0030D28529
MFTTAYPGARPVVRLRGFLVAPYTLTAIAVSALLFICPHASAAQAADQSAALAPENPQPPNFLEQCKPGKNKTPPWLQNKPLEESSWFTSQQWYKNWLQTTTTLCTDLATRLKDDNLKDTTIHWRTDRHILFRGGSGRTPEQIFEYGIWPWKVNGEGSLKLFFPEQYTEQSALTNTGYSPYYIFAYGVQGGGNGYVIDAPGGVDRGKSLSDTSNSSKNVVLFLGGIQSRFIKGVFRKADSSNPQSPIEFIANPNFQGTNAKAGEFDLITVEGDAPDLALKVSPEGEKVGANTRRYKEGTTVIISTERDKGGCWYMNGEPQLEQHKSKQFSLTADNRKTQTVVVYRDLLKENKCR